MKKIYALLIGIISCGIIHAQSTFSEVYNLLQTKCADAGCHGGASPSVYSVDGSLNDVYNTLVGVAATNPTAAAKGHKRVDPGYPSRSFLLRKIAHGLSPDLKLEQPFEGENMPKGKTKLSDTEIEIVRQWILAGAPLTGKVVNTQLIADYYNGQGTKKLDPVSPPNPSEGIQLYEGPHFVAPGDESEFLHKVHLRLPDDVEVYRIDVQMHQYSHHMILYKYFDNGYQGVAEGVRKLNNILDQADVNVNAENIGTWQFDRNLELPEGTAYFWDEQTRIDVNYHIPNYNQDSILAAEVYINIYYRPKQTSTIEMHAALAVYGMNNFNPYQLNILNNGQDTTFSFSQRQPGQTWHFWTMQAHTHQLGEDFDVYHRNPDGTKGAQIYEGFYNQDYQFNQGFYDWEHPAILTFEPFLTVDMSKGLIHEAKYNNNGPVPVGFGLTSKDEMFITYFQYTTALPQLSDIEEQPSIKNAKFQVFPNPSQDVFNISYALTQEADVKLEAFDLLGSSLGIIADGHKESGWHTHRLDLQEKGFTSGIYLINLSVNGSSITKKIIQVE